MRLYHEQIHLGNLIKTFARENNISNIELARRIGKTRQNIYDLYKRDDIEVKLFLTISNALNHNFIDDLYLREEQKGQNQQEKDTQLLYVNIIFDHLKDLVKKKIEID